MKGAATQAGAAVAALFGIILVVVVAFGATDSPAQPPGCTAAGGIASSAAIEPATLDAINALKPQYDQAAADNGIPWAILAAVDYREDGNDPTKSALSGEPIGSTNPDSGVVTTTKLDGLEQAAAHIKAMASSVYGVALGMSNTPDEIGYAFLAYNRGYIYKNANQPADTSPYVMNQFDAAHVDMTWPSIPGEPLAGNVEYSRYGALTLFSRLGGSSDTGCPALSGNGIVAIAQQQLGLHEIPDGCNCGSDIQKFLGSSPGEQWCADFVSWVYLQAGHPFTGGSDGGWRLAGVEGLRQWLVANAIYHSNGDGDIPQPGDVVIFSGADGNGHTGVLESYEGSTLTTIEGNTTNEVGRRSYQIRDSEVLGWGRLPASAGAPAAAGLNELVGAPA